MEHLAGDVTVGEILISEIHFGNRQRTECGTKEFQAYIKELSGSIRKFGLLHPITLDRDNTLRTGFCRIMAFADLGRSSIPFRYLDELTEIEKEELELEENIRRRNLEWHEEAAAVARIHALKQKQDPEWSIEKTAQLLGKSKGSTSESITVAKAIVANPTIREEKGATSAVRKIQTERAIEKKKVEIAAVKKARGGNAISAQVMVGDALALIRTMPDESFDCVATNFPFGIDLELKNEGGENRSVYKDDEDTIVDLIQAMVPEIFRVLRPDSWFIGLFDVKKITYNEQMYSLGQRLRGKELETWKRGMGLRYWLEEANFSYVRPTPFIWAKPNKTQGMIGNPQKGMITGYEAGIFASKGDAVLLRQGRSDLFVFDSPLHSERVHPLQMSTPLCLELLNMVVLGGARVLDPFSGSAAFGLAALEKQCEFVGFEINPELASLGQMRLDEFQQRAPEAP